MTFQDVFKSSFLEKAASFSVLDTVLALVLAFVLGLFIFLVYKKTFHGVMYSASFGVSMLAMTMVTTLIILAVTSNVILSLGMVGALSIVRFRSAIKEPLDIAFLFWSISVGIVLGAGLIPLAVIGSLFIGVIMVLFVNKKTTCLLYTSRLQQLPCCSSQAMRALTSLETRWAGSPPLSGQILMRQSTTRVTASPSRV